MQIACRRHHRRLQLPIADRRAAAVAAALADATANQSISTHNSSNRETHRGSNSQTTSTEWLPTGVRKATS
jgi:hypothetical protein